MTTDSNHSFSSALTLALVALGACSHEPPSTTEVELDALVESVEQVPTQ